jgi:phosphoribosylamine--glycine ligase
VTAKRSWHLVPKKIPAGLEGSKIFMKDICSKYNIPTAAYRSFTRKKI